MSFNIVIGLPGSGKTTVVKGYCENHKNAVYVSSDEVRAETNSTNNEYVFSVVHKKCIEQLLLGKDVFMDATNLSRKRRITLINKVKKETGAEVNAFMTCMPIDAVLENNLTRTERFIPYDTIVKYLRTIDVPLYYEGYKEIYLVSNYKDLDKYNVHWFEKKAKDYDQGNPYHNETLWKHTQSVRNNIGNYKHLIKNAKELVQLRTTAMYHDVGKMYTREYNATKGYYTYYNHEKVSAYIWYCFASQYMCKNGEKFVLVDKSTNDVATLIVHHMDFYGGNLEKTRQVFNDDVLFESLLILHNADEERNTDNGEIKETGNWI